MESNPPPAKSVAVHDDGVGFRHGTSRGDSLGRCGLLQAVQEIRRACAWNATVAWLRTDDGIGGAQRLSIGRLQTL
jgi:hypothetical protein